MLTQFTCTSQSIYFTADILICYSKRLRHIFACVINRRHEKASISGDLSIKSCSSKNQRYVRRRHKCEHHHFYKESEIIKNHFAKVVITNKKCDRRNTDDHSQVSIRFQRKAKNGRWRLFHRPQSTPKQKGHGMNQIILSLPLNGVLSLRPRSLSELSGAVMFLVAQMTHSKSQNWPVGNNKKTIP